MSSWVYTNDMSADTEQKWSGDLLRKARKARGLRQEDVAGEIGVHVKQVGRWESGENTPRGLNLVRLVQLLRRYNNAPDLILFDAIIDEEVLARSADAPDDRRAQALVLIDRLAPDPHRFDLWLTYGRGLADATDIG